MLKTDYPMYLVTEDLILDTRQWAADVARGLTVDPDYREYLPVLRDIPQALLCRGSDLEEMRSHLAYAMAVAHRAGLTANISEGWDRASDYLLGKWISEPAVAGYVVMTFNTIYQRNESETPQATVRNLAHLYLSLSLLARAEQTQEAKRTWSFLLL